MIGPSTIKPITFPYQEWDAKLRKYRISRRRLAEYIGRSKTYIVECLNGTRQPPQHVIEEIQKGFDELTSYVLFTRKELDVLKILIARSVEKQEVMQEFSYDESMSREEADIEWHGRLRQAIKETTLKPDCMSEQEWDRFLGKLQ